MYLHRKKNRTKISSLVSLLNLVGGTAVSQIILLLALPIITHLYTPEDFGVFAIFTSILTIIIPFATLRLEKAIFLCEETAEEVGVASLILSSAIVIAIITGLMGWSLVEFFNLDYGLLWILYLPAGVLVTSIYRLTQNQYLLHQELKSVSTMNISKSLKIVFLQISLPFLGAYGLVIGSVVSNIYEGNRYWLNLRYFFDSKYEKLKLYAIKHQSFPKYDIWYASLLTLAQQSVTIILGIAFGPTTAGLYAFSQRVVAAPTGLLATSFGQLFSSKSLAHYRKGELTKFFLLYYNAVAKIGSLIALLVILFSAPLLKALFSEEWNGAIIYVQILSVLVMFRFFTTPFTYLFALLNEQKVGVYFQSGNLIFRLLATVLGVYFYSVEFLLFNLSVVSAFLYMGMLYYFARQLDVPYYKIIISIVDGLFRASVFCLPIYFFVYSNDYGMFGISASIIIATFLMFLLYRDVVLSLMSNKWQGKNE